MAADASFSTVMLSMSAAFNEFKSRPGIPSITISGLFSFSVLFPLTRIKGESFPGSPDCYRKIPPGSRPASALETLETGADVSSSLLTEVTEPITFSLRWVP